MRTKEEMLKRSLAAGILLAMLVLATGIASAADWHVYPGDSIQDAINNAAAGDTIYVHEGTYNEYMIDVNKRLSLIGDGIDKTILDGAGGDYYLMKVSTDWVNVSEFTLRNLQNCGSGVMRVYGSHCNISDNHIHLGQAFTFYMGSGTEDNVLKGNNIHDASCGCEHMFTIDGTNHVVTDNTIGISEGGYYDNAIYVSCTGSLIYNNKFGLGISVPGADNTWNTTYASGENILGGPYMGGNYYENYVGSDEYSGPEQNQPGSDGIGDTPYGSDYLPLVFLDMPDLVISEKFETWVVEGSTYNITYTVENTGCQMAGASETGIYIDGVLEVTDEVPELNGGESYTNTVEGPFEMTDNSDMIKVCADYNSQIDEANEENNCLENEFYKNVCGAGTGRECKCGDTVVGDWTFTADLTCDSGHGLIIGAEGITIDGAGYAITGNESAGACTYCDEQAPEYHCGIVNRKDDAFDNVVIKNLEITSFCNGIAIVKAFNNTIDNCVIHHNGNATDGMTHGVHTVSATNLTITNCEIYGNTGIGTGCGGGGNGIFIFGSQNPDYNLIHNNSLHDNRKGGFFTKRKMDYSKITSNTVWGNGQGGIILRCKGSNFNLIENNDASYNYGDGIFIGGKDNTIQNNLVNNNIAGFRMGPTDIVGDGDGIDMGRSDGSFNNEVYGNTVCDNEGTDIDTYGLGSGTTGDENTCDTTSNYDDEGTTGCTYGCVPPIAPTTPFAVNGRTFDDAGGALDDCTVTVENLDTPETWTASTSATSNYYRLVITSDDVSIGDTLRFNATKESYSGTATHTVTEGDINEGGLFGFDLTLIPANQPPVSDPNGPYEGTEGVEITFDGSGSYDPDGTIELYEWDFGDEHTGMGVSPTHTYAQDGTYTVTLTVTDNEGATDTNATTATIADTEPIADFYGTPTSGLVPLTVHFTDGSTSYDGITSWNWDFGDEETSHEQNPTHEYTEAGTYTVSLTVSEDDGGSDTKTKVDYITVSSAPVVTTYDFNTGAGSDKWAYRKQHNVKPPATNNVPTIGFTSSYYNKIKVNDNSYQVETTSSNGNYAIHRFKFDIAEPVESITKIEVLWDGAGYIRWGTRGATLYIWNFNTGRYEQLERKTNTYITLSGTRETNIDDYIDANGNLIIIPEQNTAQWRFWWWTFPSIIGTDYVKVDITHI